MMVKAIDNDFVTLSNPTTKTYYQIIAPPRRRFAIAFMKFIVGSPSSISSIVRLNSSGFTA